MTETRLKGLHQSHLTAEETPALAGARIHMTGLMRAYERPRRRAIDVAQHRLLHLTVAGEGNCLVNGRWISVPAGTAYIVPQGAEWTWRYEARTTPWEQVFVVLEPDFEVPVPAEHTAAYILRNCDPTDLLWAYHQLYKESLGKGRLPIMASLSEILACLARELLDEEEHHYVLSNLWMVVAHDLTRAWNLAALCKEAGMGQEKLRLLCHKETGRSPIAQVAHLRMRHAAVLIDEGELNVQQIGSRVGYDSPFNFSLAFKRHYGLSPTHFRKQQSSSLR